MAGLNLLSNRNKQLLLQHYHHPTLSHHRNTNTLPEVGGKVVTAAKLRISIGWWEAVADVLPSLVDLNGCVYGSGELEYLERYSGANSLLTVLEFNIAPECVTVENILRIEMENIRGHIMALGLVVENFVI